MVICSTIRASGYVKKGSRTPYILRRVFWQQIEGCIAVMMASITIFRTLFTTASRRQDAEAEEESQRPSFLTRLLRQPLSWKKSSVQTGESVSAEGVKGNYIELATMPSATFTGIRSFIRRHQRVGPVSTVGESEFDPLEADYHAQIRGNAN